MQEGWHGDEYLILFDASEVPDASARYDIASSLPGYEVIGLRGWDDLIIRDAAGATFTVPTVPVISSELEPFQIPIDVARLAPDARFAGRIKWYTQPMVFGGDPEAEENLTWVDRDQHSQLVRWWNEKYRELASDNSEQ
jgi:hypothetical protein